MRQQILCLAILVFTVNFFSLDASSQKDMKLNDSLLTDADRFSVKRRYGRILYEFGPYKTLQENGSSKTTTLRSNNLDSIQSSGVVFLVNETDTAIMTLSSSEKWGAARQRSGVKFFPIDEFSIGGKTVTVEEGRPSKLLASNLDAVIKTNRDTSNWNLTFIKTMDTVNRNHFHYTGMVTDGTKKIEIRVLENVEDPAFHYRIGYEFYLDGVAVAALQTVRKKFLWLKKDVDENMKLVLAAAVYVLLDFG